MISIVVPVYNVAKYLRQCLDSLVNQTYRNLEIICVNDGSKDDSLDILQEYAAKDTRIKVISQENQGLSAARNKGMEYVTGEWTMFVDSDDWVSVECCQTLIEQVRPTTDLCFHNYVREFKGKSAPKYIYGKTRMEFSSSDIDRLYVRLLSPTGKELRYPDKLDSLSTVWGKLYRTSILKEHAIQFVSTREIGTEDLLFNVYCFTWIKEAIYLPAPLYHYRKDNVTSLTNLYRPKLRAQWNVLFGKIHDWIEPLQRPDLQYALQCRKALCLIGMGLNAICSSGNSSEQIRELSDIIHSPSYMEAIKVLPLKYFPIHWMVFYGLAKAGCAWGVWCLLRIMRYLIWR